MTLEIIGSGFGRSGTKSLKAALETLGYEPCHHMHEVLANPGQVPHWQAFARGEPVDWDAVYTGYVAQVDWPGAAVWRETAEAFPNAKVIHTVRPEERWWASFEKTIGKLMTRLEDVPMPPHIHGILTAWHEFEGKPTFGGRYDDREIGLAAFRKRTDDVREAIPADRLLIFDVAEGWGPLCDLLDKPVPDAPFPHHNLRADFWEVLGGEPT